MAKAPIAYDVATAGKPSVVSAAGLTFTPSVKRVIAERLNADQLRKLLEMPTLMVEPVFAEEPTPPRAPAAPPIPPAPPAPSAAPSAPLPATKPPAGKKA